MFSYSRRESIPPDIWATFEQLYSAFDCGDTCTTPGQKLDPSQAWKLDIAVSHQLGGVSGPGRVVVDQIEAAPSFSLPPAYAGCAGYVIGRGNGCPANMEAVTPGMSDEFCTDTFVLPSPVKMTQIRIEMTRKALAEFGYSLYEVEAYGPDDPAKNLLQGGAVSASSIEDDRYIAPHATDGDMISRWASAMDQDLQWLEITLPPPTQPQPALVDRIVLKWERAYAAEYCVIVRPAE